LHPKCYWIELMYLAFSNDLLLVARGDGGLLRYFESVIRSSQTCLACIYMPTSLIFILGVVLKM